MSYPISEQLISYNRSGVALSPQGLVIHSTATPGATAQREHDYFNSGYRAASAHYFVDWSQIIRCIPENEKAWHAGPTANARYLSIEMCESADPLKFQEVWNRTVWLAADICTRYGWNKILSHNEISNLYGETDHTDPIQYLAQYGKSWNDLIAAINAEIDKIKIQEVNTVENLVIYFGEADIHAAALLAYKLQCPMVFKAFATPAVLAVAKNKHLVGGPEDIPGAIYYSGTDRLDTAKKVLA